MRIFITGAAGFIGFHVARALVARGHEVLGVDSLDPYYDPALKRARLAELAKAKGFRFIEADIAEKDQLESVGGRGSFDIIVHLAAQPGVRYALENPSAYTRANLVGHHHMLELARRAKGLKHFVYASSSSVYGNDTTPPYSEDTCAGKPVSYYGATKRAGELMSHSYAELYGLKQTGLRFFTVYGPWGRPDMAVWSFTAAVSQGWPVKVYGRGLLKRDFTFVDDIVAAMIRIVETPFVGADGRAPHRIYNLGNNRPEEVNALIRFIERATGKTAIVEHAEAPPGDVRETYADITRAARDFGFAPAVTLEEGIGRFVAWYREFKRA